MKDIAIYMAVFPSPLYPNVLSTSLYLFKLDEIETYYC